MTSILDLDLNILKSYWRTKTEVSVSRLSNVRAETGQTDRQTDATERNTTPHSQLVKSEADSRYTITLLRPEINVNLVVDVEENFVKQPLKQV